MRAAIYLAEENNFETRWLPCSKRETIEHVLYPTVLASHAWCIGETLCGNLLCGPAIAVRCTKTLLCTVSESYPTICNVGKGGNVQSGSMHPMMESGAGVGNSEIRLLWINYVALLTRVSPTIFESYNIRTRFSHEKRRFDSSKYFPPLWT